MNFARLGFSAIIAMAAGVVFALWLAPSDTLTREAEAPLVAEVPQVQPEHARAAQRADVEPSAIDAVAAPVESPASPVVETPPEVVESVTGTPTLPEEDQTIVEVARFEPDLGGDAAQDAPAEANAGLMDASARDRVESDPGDDLVRRMLALYRAMRD